jgi:hypothetical protein
MPPSPSPPTKKKTSPSTSKATESPSLPNSYPTPTPRKRSPSTTTNKSAKAPAHAPETPKVKARSKSPERPKYQESAHAPETPKVKPRSKSPERPKYQESVKHPESAKHPEATKPRKSEKTPTSLETPSAPPPPPFAKKSAPKSLEKADFSAVSKIKRPEARSFLTTHERWLRLDRWLTALAILGLLGFIGLVYGVNTWSMKHGAKELHPLRIRYFSYRARAWLTDLQRSFSPPLPPASLGYEKEIIAAAIRYRLKPYLLKAMIKKNADFNPSRIGRDGAVGLMQLTPAMAHEINESTADFFNPKENIRIGAAYLRHLLQRRALSDALDHYRRQSCPSCEKQPQLVVTLSYAEEILDLSERYARDPGQQIRRAALRR